MIITIITLVIFFVFIAIAAVLVLLEKKFIQQRKKGEWILPVIITVMAVGIMIFAGNGLRTNSNIAHYVMIWNDKDTVGDLAIIKDREKHVLGVGFLKLDTGKGYIEVEFQDGELIGSKDALPYKKAIMKSAGDLVKGFTGSSLDYEDVEELTQKTEKLPLNFKDGWTWYGIMWRSLLPVVLWSMLLVSSWRRKKRKQLDKTKLEDL